MLSKKPWQSEYVLMFAGALVMSFCLTGLLVMILHKAAVTGFADTDSFGFLLCGTLGIQGVTWILIPIFLKLHQTGWRQAFGLDHPDWGRSMLLAIGLLVLVLPLILLLQNLCVALLTRLGFPPENQKAVEMFLNAKTPWAQGYFVFFAIVLAPVAEEFIFRGVLYPFVKQLGWPRLAFFGVSALFALIHFDTATFIPLFTLALLFTWIYEKTDCLLASITAHALFNTTNVLLLFFLPEISDFMQHTLHLGAPQ
jgi:membrane protease YdiL (CAAX protease family)